ncbi:MAG: hypothetical protein IIY28_09620 [Lachnospiraceae bacterium]|nr:hypothetical protein [Lachnospiraceae bacterium]
MAYYNTGFPVSYQPMYQVPYQPQAQTQQAQQSGLIWVQGEAAAKSYLVAPGSTVQLWDSEEKVIYLKSADASGMPSMKVLDYTIRGEEQEKPAEEYATKAEVAALAEKIKELTAKKKPARVIREEEDDE